MLADGELPPREAARAETHLAACWECRTRKQELETAISEFVRFQRSSFKSTTPADGPKALLRARVAQQADIHSHSGLLFFLGPKLGWAALLLILISGLTPLIWRQIVPERPLQPVPSTVPNPSLTPGATVLLSQPALCREFNVNNKFVPVALQKKVFAEYGIRGAEPGAYEIDYLITPALGGADDIHNLWPESNRMALWNAHVKDALEDRLRAMVCGGQLDLHVAQRDISTNWIEAYKKYFHTDRPLHGNQQSGRNRF